MVLNTLDKTLVLSKPDILERYPGLVDNEQDIGGEFRRNGIRQFYLGEHSTAVVTHYKTDRTTTASLLTVLEFMLGTIPVTYRDKAALITHVLANVHRNGMLGVGYDTVCGICLEDSDVAPECITVEIYVAPYVGLTYSCEVIVYSGETDNPIVDALWSEPLPTKPTSKYKRTVPLLERYPELIDNEVGEGTWLAGYLTEYELPSAMVQVYTADDVNENTLRDVWNALIKLLGHVEFTKIAYRLIAEFSALADTAGVIDKSYYHQGIDSSVAVRYHIPVSINGRYNPEIIVYKGDPNTETYRTMTTHGIASSVRKRRYDVTDLGKLDLPYTRRFKSIFGPMHEDALVPALDTNLKAFKVQCKGAYPGTPLDKFNALLRLLDVELCDYPQALMDDIYQTVISDNDDACLDVTYTATFDDDSVLSFNVYLERRGAGVNYLITGYRGNHDDDFIGAFTDLMLDIKVATDAGPLASVPAPAKRIPWNTPVPAILGTDTLKADCIKQLPNRLFHRVLVSYAGTPMAESILGDTMLKQAITAAKSIKTHYGNRQYNYVIELPEQEGIATILFYSGFSATEVDDMANEFLDKIHDIVKQLPSDMSPDGVIASVLRLLDGGHRGLGYILTPRESNAKARHLPDNLSRRWADRILRHDPK